MWTNQAGQAGNPNGGNGRTGDDRPVFPEIPLLLASRTTIDDWTDFVVIDGENQLEPLEGLAVELLTRLIVIRNLCGSFHVSDDAFALNKRMTSQRCVLRVIDCIVFAGLLLTHIVFFQITAPAMTWLKGLF